ncbi:hypothetical protein FHB44_11920 [Escherichia coli]|uniref:hypothetical protein n=1 Tax=Escherichia coli TaxID=562 RepID=UPI001C6FD6CF|nr:hypothetical protein [Escherichia coli]MBW9339312.1 hypothetical protein [Escherichia coli]MBW9356577.1 hypothetical protein [Escherichia coli]MBW9373501.1 hypothetical protein [Escherichia coli]
MIANNSSFRSVPLIAGVFFLPSLLMVMLKASSFSSGLLLVCVLFVFFFIVGGKRQIHKKSILMMSVVMFLVVMIAMHFIVISLFIDGGSSRDYGRMILSLIMLLFMSLTAIVACSYIGSINDGEFSKSIKFIAIVLVANGIVGMLGLDVFNTGLIKPVLAFQEPSHFILCSIPFFIYFYKTSKTKTSKTLLILMFLIFGLYVKNLIAIASIVFVISISSKKTLLSFIFIFIVFLIVLYLVPHENLSYFADRININNLSNMSLLALVQGWENAILSFSENPFGEGFQQMGITTATGAATYALRVMVGADVNILDGGSTAPKVIAEFGMFGIIFLIVYAYMFIKIAYRLKKSSGDRRIIFMYSCFLATFFDLFVRGAGYFTPTLFMGVTSLMYIFCYDRNTAPVIVKSRLHGY